MNALVEAALARAREGAYIIPLYSTDYAGVCACHKKRACASPGKHPRTEHGADDASRDPSTIQRWWRQWPDANVGVRTDDVVRIDIDLADVGEELAADTPLRALTELVRTPTRRGLHVALRPARRVRGRDLYLSDGRKLGELKAAGGYVLVEPSVIAGKRYERISPEGVEPLEVDDPIDWLRRLLPAFGCTLAQETGRPKRAYEDLVETIHEGEGRHNALKSYAGLLWIEGMPAETLIALLRAMNDAQCRPPLPDDELSAIAGHFIDQRERRATHDPAMVCGVQRPEIMITNRHRRDIAGDAWEALVAANDPVRFFRHGNSVAEVRKHDKSYPVVRHLGSAGLGGRLDRCADFVKWTDEGDRPARPPRRHYPVEQNIAIGHGHVIDIPPAPGVYPSDAEIPREVIPYILELGGAFVGYHCMDADTTCENTVRRLEAIVRDRIDNRHDRIVMAHDADLPVGEIGLAAWTRVERAGHAEFTQERLTRFIDAHACRYDPLQKCRDWSR